MLDDVEPESKKPMEQAPVKETNPKLNQGKPTLHSTIILDFILMQCFMLSFFVH
jgi:hypothetical protein